MSLPDRIHNQFGGDDLAATYAALDVFRKHDVHCDGILDRGELQTLFSELDRAYWSNDRVDELIRQADANRNGKVDYGELLRWLFKDVKYQNYIRCQNLLDGVETYIEFGNTAQRLDENTYDWTFYVRGGGIEEGSEDWIAQCIEEVIVELHPTFRDPVKTLHGPPFKLTSRGWGTFPLKITVKWISAGGTIVSNFTWMLQFAKADACKKAYVPVTAWRHRKSLEASIAEMDETPQVAEFGGTCTICGGEKGAGIECVGACLCDVDCSGD
eukprot:TRINITY_DN70453_c0_g1_i1.p1 TRINITY_DN70453_c0_g1~~TRINITY_DN70453_c0_g1_i1.p1  ORF type:complete len:270 (-),score=44.37 TRINITY_DN70453_c0_g1_i1:16-825(-)